MKLLGPSPGAIDLRRIISEGIQGDYVYMYPPRQAYRPLDPMVALARIDTSLKKTAHEPVNLYLHFPFCKQICRFCNLYAVATAEDSGFDEYVSALLREATRWAEVLDGRAVETIYLGGGTPSLMPVEVVARVLLHLERAFGTNVGAVPEVALEVAPDTVDFGKLLELRELGINRVNLGLQSANDDEIRKIGRTHGFHRARKSISDALEAGFSNVCVDLIYGLPGQSEVGWRRSVEEVIRLNPQTICPYPLTLRPRTGFSRSGVEVRGPDQYRKYDLARSLLLEAGYEQETHVRYVRPGVGGYRQKANHWAGQDVLGMGAGARGYLREVDYRNGYSLKSRRSALNGYYEDLTRGFHAIRGGLYLDPDERLRRAVILGLLHLDRASVRENHGTDPVDAFSELFGELEDLRLVTIEEEFVGLTECGRKYRDLIAQKFFSQRVWRLISEFDYSE